MGISLPNPFSGNNSISFADVEGLSSSFGGSGTGTGNTGIGTPGVTAPSVDFNPFSAGMAAVGLPFGGLPFSFNRGTVDIAGQSFATDHFSGSGGTFGGNGAGVNESGFGGPGNQALNGAGGSTPQVAIADELLRTGQAGTFEQAMAMAARGVRPPQQQSEFMDVGRIVSDTPGGFNPADPNRPINTDAFKTPGIGIRTPGGVFSSKDGQSQFDPSAALTVGRQVRTDSLLNAAKRFEAQAGEFSGENGQFEFDPSAALTAQRGERKKSLLDAANRFEAQAGQFSTKPLQKASRDVFEKTIKRASDRRTKEVGDLGAQLSRRRIFGPLASGSVAQLEQFFGDQEGELTAQQAQIEAQLGLTELESQFQLETQASQARIEAYQLEVQDLVGDTALASELAASFANMEEINLRTRMLVAQQEADSIRSNLGATERTQINAAAGLQTSADERAGRNAAGIGSFIGSIFGSSKDSIGGSLLGRGIKGIFG